MKEVIESYIRDICNEFDRVDWSDPEIYAAYCSQLHYYSRHTTRIIALGAGRMPIEDKSGHDRYTKHVQEEKNHEVLSIRDCEALGYSVFDFPELASTKAFYQTQYYMILTSTPWAFIGYALVLEGLAVKKAPDLYKVVTKHHGPRSGSFLKVHGEEDEDHFPLALKMVEERSEFEKNAILESAYMTAHLHKTFLQELPIAILEMRKNKKKNAA